MANLEQVEILRLGSGIWNEWREKHSKIQPDLSDTDLTGAGLIKANLKRANLRGTNLCEANLREANLEEAVLTYVDLRRAILFRARLCDASLMYTNLTYTDCDQANFEGANLFQANLTHASLKGANLCVTNLVDADMTNAILDQCKIWGTSVWDVRLEGASQLDLVITPWGSSPITVDNLEIAQFIYLLLNNAKIRDVIDTIARKAVLILGRFTPPRKVVLDAIREALRTQGHVPILFDFDKPASHDLTGTVSTLAHLARFIIVDLTDPSSAPHEVATVIPQTVVPVQPLILNGEREYSMFRDLRQRYHWVLPTYSYTDLTHLLSTLQEHVIAPAEQKARELEKR